ncbi:ABC transporter permease, partial [Alistipes putredinis]|uniref:ABC transporter permease n=1 Tax=Alistipes putredinis TaxID=28117 RepID=UPI003AB0E88B
VNPVRAIRYQIMVTFMLLSATSLGSIIACYLANLFSTKLPTLSHLLFTAQI